MFAELRSTTLARRHWLSYGVLGLPLAMAALPVYVHVPHLYAEAGVNLAMLGALLLAARLLDAAMDPLLGWWADRSSRRQGLILLALPFLALGMLGLMHPQETQTVLWLLLSLVATYFGFSLASIVYQSWGAELGGNSAERTLLTASREGFGLVGVVLAAMLPMLLASDSALGLSRLSWLFAPLLVMSAVLTLVGAPAAKRDRGSDTSPTLLAALSDRRFCRLVGVFVANGVAAALPATLVLFFVSDVLKAEAWGGVFLAIYFLAAVAGLPFWVTTSQRIGRVRAWLMAIGLACVTFAGAFMLGEGDVWLFALVCLASGLALGADMALPPALLADIAESHDAKVGAGGYFGWWNLVAKLNLALAAGIALPVLGGLGYQPSRGGNSGSGSDEGLLALALVYCLLPIIFKLLAAVLLWRWRDELEGS